MERFESDKAKNERSESIESNKEKLGILEYIRTELGKSNDIVSARVYGSWLHSDNSTDLDICVMIPSADGIVDSDVYRRLKVERQKLSKHTAQDVDLVPHTMDEIADWRSDIYHPRYNPSLVAGLDLKSQMAIQPIFDKSRNFTYTDLAAHILLDNRTVCRRQIIRSLTLPERKIFSSKLLHGPGNALTYDSCRNQTPFHASPADFPASLKMFDRVYKVNSSPASDFLLSCKRGLDPVQAPILLKWYEHLVALVLQEGKHVATYQKYCAEVGDLSTPK
jgi:predicted nucleotidyltransferase